MAYDVNYPANDLAIADIPLAIRTKGADVKDIIDAHVADTTSAHAASSIENTPAGGIAATNVQTALNELDTEKAPKASPTFTGTVSGISGTMITNTPAGGIAATTVQAALNELDTEKVSHSLSTAASDFLVGSGSNTLIKRTLAETKTILGVSNVTNNAQVKKISSSVDNQVMRWDGTSGDTPQGSLVTIDDSGSINIPNEQTYRINGTSLNASHVSALPTSYLDTDTTLAANSDTKIPSQKAIKAYVDGNTGSYGERSWLTAGTYSWTAPAGVTKVSVEIGAGGGGGSRGGTHEPGAGGGAGEYKPAEIYTVTPGTSYTVVVGAGGTGSSSSSSNGGQGGTSSFGALVSCTGGYGGQKETDGGYPAGGANGGGLYSQDGASVIDTGGETPTKYAGCGGSLSEASGKIGIGGGSRDASLLADSFVLIAKLLRWIAGNYAPTGNGTDAVGVCAGGGGGPQTTSASRGGNGANGFVRIRYW